MRQFSVHLPIVVDGLASPSVRASFFTACRSSGSWIFATPDIQNKSKVSTSWCWTSVYLICWTVLVAVLWPYVLTQTSCIWVEQHSILRDNIGLTIIWELLPSMERSCWRPEEISGLWELCASRSCRGAPRRGRVVGYTNEHVHVVVLIFTL